ncbi:MAG: 50S ribosomal protein L18 [Candidatus Shikimatogenerans sp. Ttur]|uniref:50S ribosomal protein L18 n=1 Tax=Candidatus Shikimatogenerans sp. Ttur TaxID=3158569 RepID=A0AAU7ZXX0_9FLAO
MIKYRLSLFISNRHIYIQIIDIIQNITIISTSTYKKK